MKTASLILLFLSLVSCVDSRINNEFLITTNNNNQSLKIIDSIYIDLNNDKKTDRVKIIESSNSSRVVIVEINSDNGFKTISSNSEIIGCSSCGYQSGDPFVDLDKKSMALYFIWKIFR